MATLEKLLAKYDYKFPPDQIAQTLASPRDTAKLLVFEKKSKKISHTTFQHLPEFLPKKAVLVFNQTKVIPARLIVNKITGGKVELLFLETQNNTLNFLANKKLEIGSQLKLNKKTNFKVISKSNSGYLLKPNFPVSKIFSILEKFGQTPLPPYIKANRQSEAKRRIDYQTIFAKTRGSVAAPTASLHFSKSLLSKLKKTGIKIEYVTLHVGLGTFASLNEANLKTGKLHQEWYYISTGTAKTLNEAKAEKRPIIGVGTTVARTLESASNSKGRLTKLEGQTDLFIKPPYKFKFINSLITNFHVPRSSLLMLVASLIGQATLMKLYQLAIKKDYKLFSLGDGMFIKTI